MMHSVLHHPLMLSLAVGGLAFVFCLSPHGQERHLVFLAQFAHVVS